MKSTVVVWLCCLAFVSAVDVCSGDEAGDREEIRNATRVVCGPKCVGYLLDYYQVSERPSLVALTRELQGRDIDQGTTLSVLSEYLAEHGVHTVPIGLSGSARLNWRYPALVHLKPPISGEIGHFVIWLPSSTSDEVRYWDGDHGVVCVPQSEWQRKRSGSVLLTSPVKIESVDGAVSFAGLAADSTYTRILSSGVLAIGLIVCCFSFWPLKFSKKRRC